MAEGGYRRRYCKPRIENKKPYAISPSTVTLSRITEDHKGHICNVGTGPQTDQFTATTKVLTSYSGRKCANPQDILISIERQKDVLIPVPTTRANIDAEVANILLGNDIDVYVKHSQQYRQNKAKICSVALGQCTEATKNRLEEEEICEDIDGDSDVIHILLPIKSIAYAYKSKSYPVLAIHM